jgi:hypothetical protein
MKVACKEELSILSCTPIYAIVNEHMVISEFVTNYHDVVSPNTRLCLFSMVQIRIELIFYYLMPYKINDFHITLHMPRTGSIFMYCVIQPAYEITIFT